MGIYTYFPHSKEEVRILFKFCFNVFFHNIITIICPSSFDDIQTAKKILDCTTPLQAKQLRHNIENVDETRWTDYRYDIMKKHVKAKFKQNPYLFLAMRKIGIDTHFAEASPTDKIWGIGLRSEIASQVPSTEWKGLNLLGKILDEVHTELAYEQYIEFVEINLIV